MSPSTKKKKIWEHSRYRDYNRLLMVRQFRPSIYTSEYPIRIIIATHYNFFNELFKYYGSDNRNNVPYQNMLLWAYTRYFLDFFRELVDNMKDIIHHIVRRP